MLSQLRKLGTQTPAVAIAGFVIVALLPLIGLNDYWQREIILIGIYTLLCSGLNLSFGYAGELALGQVAARQELRALGQSLGLSAPARDEMMAAAAS